MIMSNSLVINIFSNLTIYSSPNSGSAYANSLTPQRSLVVISVNLPEASSYQFAAF